MSTHATVAEAGGADRERAHRLRLITGYVLAMVLVLALAIYGFDYYRLGAAERPFSPKHALLKPGGSLGIKLGFLGAALFFGIFLYPLRKRWPWLMRQGSTKHWLDIHVLMGLSAPFVIAFHCAFKFGGFAGMAFWIMVAVALSGVVGRYLYGQIPHSLSAAELSRRELQEMQAQMAARLAEQKLLPQADLHGLLRLPSPERVARLPLVVAVAYMLALDVARPLRVARLRCRVLGLGESLLTLDGLLPTGHRELEQALAVARADSALAKRILFLERSQQVFHLWHVVHKPFSYSFAVLALLHIAVVMVLGFA